MSELVIIGSGGFAKELAWLWAECKNSGQNVPELIGFISEDDSFPAWNGIPTLGNDSWAASNLSKDVSFLIGVGQSSLRKDLALKYESMGLKTITLIHPSVTLGTNTHLGSGTVICAGCTITVEVQIGRHVLCNLHTTIGHDSVVGDFSVISPGVHISGYTAVGECVELGTGAVTVPGVHISDQTIIGAGTVITKDLPQPGTYVGNPARKIR